MSPLDVLRLLKALREDGKENRWKGGPLLIELYSRRVQRSATDNDLAGGLLRCSDLRHPSAPQGEKGGSGILTLRLYIRYIHGPAGPFSFLLTVRARTTPD